MHNEYQKGWKCISWMLVLSFKILDDGEWSILIMYTFDNVVLWKSSMLLGLAMCLYLVVYLIRARDRAFRCVYVQIELFNGSKAYLYDYMLQKHQK